MHAMVRASYPLPPESSTQTSTTASRSHFFSPSQFPPSSTEPTPPKKTSQEDTKPLDLETTPSVRLRSSACSNSIPLPSPLSALPTTTTIIVFGNPSSKKCNRGWVLLFLLPLPSSPYPLPSPPIFSSLQYPSPPLISKPPQNQPPKTASTFTHPE